MPRNDDPENRLLEAVLKAQKYKLSVEDFSTVVKLLAESSRDRLLAQIAQFLMAIIACTFVLLTLHSVGVVHLPANVVDKLAILFGAEIVALLGVIVRDLTKTKGDQIKGSKG